MVRACFPFQGLSLLVHSMRILPCLFVLGITALAPCQGGDEPAYRFLVTGQVSEIQQSVLEDQYDILECSARKLEPPFEVVVQMSQLASFYELGLDTKTKTSEERGLL